MTTEQESISFQEICLSPREKVFLASVAASCLVVSIAFAAATVFGRYGFPATLVAFLFGVTLATLSYAFLGGVRGNEANIGGFKVVGTVAVVALTLTLLPGPLHKEMNDLVEIEKGRQAQRKLVTMLQHPAEEAIPLVLDATMGGKPISGGGTVRLINVRASQGKISRLGPDEAGQLEVLEGLLDKAHIPADPAELMRKSPGELEKFLSGVSPEARSRFNEIPFAELEVSASDSNSYRVVAFSQAGAIPIKRTSGEAEAYICVRRIFDISEGLSGEREAIVLDHGTKRCK